MHPFKQINLIKIFLCFFSALALGGLTYVNVDNQAHFQGVLTGSLGIIALSGAITLILHPKPGRRALLDWGFIVILWAFIFHATLNQSHSLEAWVYFFPIAAFYLFKLKWATYLSLAYVPFALTMIMLSSDILNIPQMVFSFSAITVISLFLAMVKTRTNHLLEPLIRTDEETGAQLEKQLIPSLTIEINRAEREGTGLLLMQIFLDQAIKHQDKNPLSLAEYARLIRKQLRPFDQYYQLKPLGFALLLPHMNTEDAKDLVQKIFADIPLEIKKTIKIGYGSLNVGDTPESLIEESTRSVIHV